jgi:CRP-like cAMP-binding protein
VLADPRGRGAAGDQRAGARGRRGGDPRPGTVVGWSWLFPPYRWNFSAVAAEATLAIQLDGPGIRRLCAEDPAIGYELTRRFMAVVVERLQATRGRLLEIGRGTVAP